MKRSRMIPAAAALTAFALTAAAGCESLPRKFIRKPKTPKHVAAVIYTEEGPYQKRYSNEYYYKTHFTMWKTWHSEIVKQFGGNSKRLERSAQESLSHLTQMGTYLDETGQAQLQPHLDSLTRIVSRIQSGASSAGSDATMRSELEKIERIVGQQFLYDKVKEHVLQQAVDLGDAEPSSGAAAPSPASP